MLSPEAILDIVTKRIEELYDDLKRYPSNDPDSLTVKGEIIKSIDELERIEGQIQEVKVYE